VNQEPSQCPPEETAPSENPSSVPGARCIESTGDAALDRKLSEPLLKGQKGIDVAQVWAAGFLVVIVGLFAYANTLAAPLHVETREFFVQSDHAGLLRSQPVGALALMINQWMAPDAIGLFHAVNIILHLINGVLVFLCCRALLTGAGVDRLAMVAGMLYLVHPLNTEAVNYVIFRPGLFATTLALGAFAVFLMATRLPKTTNTAALLVAMGLYVAAVLSHPMALVLPFLLMAAERLRAQEATSADRVRRHAGFWAAFGVLVVLRFVLGGIESRAAEEPSFVGRFSTFLALFPSYLRMAFAPNGLNVEHAEPFRAALSAPGVAYGTLLFALCLLAAAFLIVRRWLGGLALLWFLLSLLGASLVPDGGLALSERRAILAVAGVVMVVPWAFQAVHRPGLRTVAGILAAALILTGGLATFRRNMLWRDEARLWNDAVAKSPNAVRPQRVLGRYFLDRGGRAEDMPTARECFRIAETYLRHVDTLEPGDAETLSDLGLALKRLGRTDEAFACFNDALAADPNCQRALMHLATLVEDRAGAQRDLAALAQAVEYYERADALGAMPGPVLARYGMALAATGDFNAAEDVLGRANVKSPSKELGQRLEEVRALARQIRAMEAQAQEVLDAKPEDPRGLMIRAQTLMMRHQIGEASDLLTFLIEKNPDNAQVWLMLGHAKAQQNAAEEFVTTWSSTSNAAQIPWEQLAVLCEKSGLPEAAKTYRRALGSPINLE